MPPTKQMMPPEQSKVNVLVLSDQVKILHAHIFNGSLAGIMGKMNAASSVLH
jgi:hypothetical protein